MDKKCHYCSKKVENGTSWKILKKMVCPHHSPDIVDGKIVWPLASRLSNARPLAGCEPLCEQCALAVIYLRRACKEIVHERS